MKWITREHVKVDRVACPWLITKFVDYRLTMGVEDRAWKITGVCDILSEGCFAVSWG